MPDKKTVYMSDDGTNVGLYMFRADTAEDLSSGRLYAAKWKQKTSTDGGSANLSWIELVHATDNEVKKILDPDGNVNTNDAPTFGDIFETTKGDEATGACPTGFDAVNTKGVLECLKVKRGMEKTAALLETRRYAALKGATTEFRKEEGITYDATHHKLYVAMSEIAQGMEDNTNRGVPSNQYDKGGSNDVKLDYNPCGAIYALDLDREYTATSMSAILHGVPIKKDSDGNTCHLDKISNPDNLSILEGSDLLFIGEDSSSHKNNVIWSYNLKTRALNRLITTPINAEATSIFWYKNINGFSYMTAVTQHPMAHILGVSGEAKESFVGVLGAITGVK